MFMLFSFDFCPFPLCTQATNARRTDSILLSSYHSGLQNTMSDTLRRVLRSRACLSHEYIVCTFVQSAAPLHRNFPYFMNPVHCFRALFCVYYRCTKEKAKQKKTLFSFTLRLLFLACHRTVFPFCAFIYLSLYCMARRISYQIGAPLFCLFFAGYVIVFSGELCYIKYVCAAYCCRRFFTELF